MFVCLLQKIITSYPAELIARRAKRDARKWALPVVGRLCPSDDDNDVDDDDDYEAQDQTWNLSRKSRLTMVRANYLWPGVKLSRIYKKKYPSCVICVQ